MASRNGHYGIVRKLVANAPIEPAIRHFYSTLLVEGVMSEFFQLAERHGCEDDEHFINIDIKDLDPILKQLSPEDKRKVRTAFQWMQEHHTANKEKRGSHDEL